MLKQFTSTVNDVAVGGDPPRVETHFY